MPQLTDITISPAPESVATTIKRALGGNSRIWTLNLGLVAVAALLARQAVSLPHPIGSFQVPWLVLAGGFYLAEVAVVHLQFRRDAHSFSMSEVPLVIGLFFAGHLDLLLAQLAGNLLALTLNRRQRPVKLVFNLAQFTMATSTAILVLNLFGAESGRLTGAAPFAAVVATLVALVVAHVLVVLAIRTSGGGESLLESLEVLGLSALATVMNTLLALGGVAIISTAPSAAWLAVGPPVFLYLAYRGYVGQRSDKAKLAALFEATKSLHRSPEIESALEAAGHEAMRLVNAEYARLLLFGPTLEDLAYLTAVGPGGQLAVMSPRPLDLTAPGWLALSHQAEASLLRDDAARLLDPIGDGQPVREAIVVPLLQESRVVGLLIAANRAGDVSQFSVEDVRLLATLGAQVGVSLENGRLSESLGEMRRLKGELEKLVASKDQLVASVSHELRTPLTGIIGLAEMLREQLPEMSPVEADELVGIIADQGTELANIIEDLLVQARAEIDTLTLHRQPMQLDAEVAAVLSGHKITGNMAIEVPRSGAIVMADPLRFRQILRNLLTNAQRYGGQRVWLEITRSNGIVRLALCDDGEGVPGGMTETIFEPYQSAHNGHRSSPGSVGLGLAVSRKIARLMGGDLRYRRLDGHTAFELSLPAA
jgi:signal transduction histidine kinase